MTPENATLFGRLFTGEDDCTPAHINASCGCEPARRPLAVDIACGRGGWSKGLLDAGFAVVGVDLLPQPAFPVRDRSHFVQADIRTLRAHELRLWRRPLLVVASPPCQGFSTMRVRNQSPPPVESFELVAHTLRLIAELRPEWWVVENVRGAWKWWAPLLGDPDVKREPYYLWGNMPDEFRPAGRYPSKLRYRDPGRRSEIPASLASGLGRAVLAATGPTSEAGCDCAQNRAASELSSTAHPQRLPPPSQSPAAHPV